MFVEFLVTAVCLQNIEYKTGDACPQALQAYYESHTEIREGLRRQELAIRRYPYANELITFVLIPTYTALVAKRVKISLSSHFSLSYYQPDQQTLIEFSIPL